MRTSQTTFLPCASKFMNSWAVVLSMGAVCLQSSVAQAQDTPVSVRPPIFPTLFKNPTGMNAYEDWVYAADLVQNNEVADTVLEPGTSLTLKRQLFHNPQVQQALLILHNSLNKPVLPPRAVIDENSRFLEFATFRKLARLLNTQIYVCFADGRVDAAMAVLSDGLRFGYRLQSDTLLSGTAGIAIETIVLKSYSQHLDQLSEYQCGRLQHFVEEWIEAPSPAFVVLANESQSAQRRLEAKRNDVAGLEEWIEQSYSTDEGLPLDAQTLLDHLKTHPGDLGPALDHAKTLIAARYDSALANLKLPLKERSSLPDFKDNSFGGKIFSMVTPSFDVVAYKFDRIDAMVRLLGIHAAIRRYKWEHDHLPNALADLHISTLNVDPFTGNSFLYKRAGDTYDLSSFGPVERNAQGKAPLVPTQPTRL